MNVVCTVRVCIISNHFILVQAIYPLGTTAEQREKSVSSSRVSLSSDSWKRTHTGTKESQQRMILCSLCLPVELTQKDLCDQPKKGYYKDIFISFLCILKYMWCFLCCPLWELQQLANAYESQLRKENTFSYEKRDAHTCFQLVLGFKSQHRWHHR